MAEVCITGIGLVTPIGNDRESFWAAALEGRSGAVRRTDPWVEQSGLSCRVVAPVSGFDPVGAGIPAREVPILDRASWFALAAAAEAVADAGLPLAPREEVRDGFRLEGLDPQRVAVTIGSGMGGLTTLEISHARWREHRSKNGIRRYSLPMLIPNAPAGQVAIRFGARGECKAVATACAAGTMAIGDAWRLVRSGEVDVVLAGGVDALAADEDAYALLGFDLLRAVTSRNDEPTRASRPFDRDRDGFVLGEGCAVLVLESEAHARARGARLHARIAGYAAGCDALSMMQPDESGASITALCRAALRSAGLVPADVDHVSAHGTSTVVNDRTESRALGALLGPRLGEVPVTSLKSMTGHAIGGSGAMETAALALSLARGILLPTINYDTPDPECPVAVVAHRPAAARPRAALKLSYGFGGHNAGLVLTPA